MKACIISHSSVHQRQIEFYIELSKHIDLLVISPKDWGNLSAEDFTEKNLTFKTFITHNTGNMNEFFFPSYVYQHIAKFKPDIIYNVEELWCKQTSQSFQWAKNLNCKFVNFIWDNLSGKKSIKDLSIKPDLIIAGNTRAKELYDADEVLPQVGINTDKFKPIKGTKKVIDVLYVGRMVESKGIHYIKQAYPLTHFINGVKYDELPGIYNLAKLHICYSYDTEEWVEQGGFSNIEALSSGLPIIVSDCGAFPEWLKGCKGAKIIQQKNVEELRIAIEETLKNPVLDRDFVLKNYSNEVIAQKLVKIFEKLLEDK